MSSLLYQGDSARAGTGVSTGAQALEAALHRRELERQQAAVSARPQADASAARMKDANALGEF